MQITLGGTIVQMLPEKALYLPEYGLLVIADLHLGKAMHFRKAGLFVPAESAHKDYQVLRNLMRQYQPCAVWFLGDLFHSDHNTEWFHFESFIRDHETVRFTLIRGNHDILKQDYYQQLKIAIVPEVLELGNLVFSHEPLNAVMTGKINIAGHIHPGCALRGMGRQSLRLPCYYWCDDLLLLPAFGALTGLRIMDHGKNVKLYAIASDRVLQL